MMMWMIKTAYADGEIKKYILFFYLFPLVDASSRFILNKANAHYSFLDHRTLNDRGIFFAYLYRGGGGGVAHWVKHATPRQGVVGSNPALAPYWLDVSQYNVTA